MTTIPNSQFTSTGLRWYWQLLLLCVAAALVVSRQPDSFLNAQFAAEDGHVWFADAYNLGWFAALFRTQDGYFQTLPRLAAALALLVPLAFAPLVTNLVGLLIQILPVPILLSNRLSRWGSMQLRGALAFTYIAMPNSREMNVTITEAQWHLALIVCLLLLASTPASRAGKVFDLFVFALCGFTGPFCLLLLPVAAIYYWLRREPFRLLSLVLLGTAAVIQVFELLLGDPKARIHHYPLGVSLDGLARILGGHVYLGTLMGSNIFALVGDSRFLISVTTVCTVIAAYCIMRSVAEFRLFILFSLLLLAASLASPMTGEPPPGYTAWRVLEGVSGIRYWFFPTLAFTWTVVYCVFGQEGQKQQRLPRRTGVTLLFLMSIGLIRDWRYPAFKDFSFAAYAGQFESSAPGSVVVIPEHPHGWTLRLVKR